MRFRFALVVALASLAVPTGAQAPARPTSGEEARSALAAARQQQRNARDRGERLEREASAASDSAGKAMQEAAALAARVQQAEAGIAAAAAELALVNQQRRELDLRLAARQAPLARLTAALQSMTRRPLVLSALQPGSLRELVYTRAVLASAIPLVRRRTAGLRGELDRAQALEAEARLALADLRDSEVALRDRRKQLVATAEAERLRARQASGGANREAQRALVLAEQAADLDQLVGQLEKAGSLREVLASLPGPMVRPSDPAKATLAQAPRPTPTSTEPPASYQLPVAGRVAAGFGEAATSGQRQAGLVLQARSGAQVVSPAAGRVAFAGPYRGYGRIVIVEHANGWSSLVTGLGQLDVSVGQPLAAGSPLGLANADDGRIALELRQAGRPVNPLDHLR